MFVLRNYYAKSKYCDNWMALVPGKVTDETADLPIKESIGLKLQFVWKLT